MIKRAAITLAMLTMLACGYDRFDGISVGDIAGNGLLPNADLSLLIDNYYGSQTVIPDNIIVEGYVTANDLTGNFFKSFVIQDGTGAIEVNAGITDLHNHYQLGRRVVIEAQGLALGSYNGVVQLGLKINPYSDWRVENFGARQVLERYVHNDMKFKAAEPAPREISSFTPPEAGKLVRIGRVVWNEAGGGDSTWGIPASSGAAPSTGIHYFKDIAGDSVAVVTSGYANFAAAILPQDSVTLTGVLLYGKFGSGRDHWGIKLRDLSDVEE